jgi:non-specific serine/threonine protein kinase/serine/threonine-protein kinase
VTTAAGAAIATSPPHADASRLARQLRGDLDWITMKALEKDRRRRYGSVSDLAADLRRHLDDVPVLASPPSVKYRVGKFVRRHRSAVAAAGALILLLVVFAAVMAVQAGRIARARDRASQEAATAKQVSEFLVGLFKVSDPSEARGTTLTAREILAKGAQQLDNLRDQPVVQARLQATIGAVDTGLGLYNDAQPLLARALQTQKRVAGEDSPETLATTHSLANLYWYIGRYDDAEPLYLAVVGARSRLLGEEHRDTLRAEFDLASLYVLQKRWEVAEALLRRTLEAQQRKLGEADLDSLESLHTLASFYYRIERYEESLPISVKVVQLRTRILGESHPDTLQSMHNLATTYEALRRYDDAEPLYLRTIDIRRQVLGDEHPELANTRFTLARLFFVGHFGMQATLTLIETFGRCGLNVARLSVSKMNVPPGLMA